MRYYYVREDRGKQYKCPIPKDESVEEEADILLLWVDEWFHGGPFSATIPKSARKKKGRYVDLQIPKNLNDMAKSLVGKGG
jgi:hypothetical protein